jgi:quinol-cytochrome oxidoreductase complex cytochrome b subunit
MKQDKKLSLWERYLTNEIGIEFKSCLYFFAILFFYCMYKVINGSFEANIIHMAEMIFSCYIICYLQILVFWNFDEADKLGSKECVGMVICTLIYTLVSFVGNWFDRKIVPSLILAAYILVMYLCVFFIYKTKRRIDDKKLNEDLKLFQTNHKK